MSKHRRAKISERNGDTLTKKSGSSSLNTGSDEPVLVSVCTNTSPNSAVLVFKKEDDEGHEKLAQFPIVKQEPIEDKDFFNPKYEIEGLKKPIENNQFDLRLVTRRMDDLNIKPYVIEWDEDLVNRTFTRARISHIFGGAPQGLLPPISAKNIAIHGFDNFFYSTFVLNPYLPQRPGFPGLMYRSRINDMPKVLRLFICVSPNNWLYCGNYIPIATESLTKEEWRDSSEEVKSRWSEHLWERKWAGTLKMSVALRKKLKKEPTESEIKEEPEITEKSITANDIRHAFDSGEEHLRVWILKCVGYDTIIQKALLGLHKYPKPLETSKPKKSKRRREDDLVGEDDDSQGRAKRIRVTRSSHT